MPTDAAIQAAYDSGTFDYPEMFARKKGQLTGMVAYHAVPQYAHTAPGPQTARMETLLSQGQGNVTCVPAPLSWRSDGFVYGGSGAGKVSGTYDRGCAAVIFQVGGARGRWRRQRPVSCRPAQGLHSKLPTATLCGIPPAHCTPLGVCLTAHSHRHPPLG